MQSIYLDTTLATILIIFLYSILGYAIQEWIAAVFEWRAKMLERAIFELLNDKLNKSFGVLLYEHPQIHFLKKNQHSLPSYIPSSNFAVALIDQIIREAETDSYLQRQDTKLLKQLAPEITVDNLDKFQQGVLSLNYSDLKVLLQTFLLESKDIGLLQLKIEAWYDRYMERVSGWYRKKISFSVGIIAVLMVLISNFDALFVIQSIYGNEQLRNSLVAQAQIVANNSQDINSYLKQCIHTQISNLDTAYLTRLKQAPAQKKEQINKDWNSARVRLIQSSKDSSQIQIDKTISKLQDLSLPIGWTKAKDKSLPASIYNDVLTYFRNNAFYKILGWILSAVLISFGAPFWFNVLIKVVPLRKTGVKPATKNNIA